MWSGQINITYNIMNHATKQIIQLMTVINQKGILLFLINMIEFDRSLLYIILGAIILVLVFYFKKRKDLGKTS